MVADRRATVLQKFLRHVREKLALDVGFVLWDGSTVPEDLPPSELAIAFADPGTVASLLRRPNIETLLNLWVTSRIDLRNGTFFDVVARRPKVRTKDFLRQLDKPLVMKTALAFLLAPAGGPRPLDRFEDDSARRDGNAATNKQNISHHYDVSNKFYSHVSRSGDGLQLRLLHGLEQRPRHRATRQARHDLPQAAPAAGRELARHRLRLGRADLPCREALRRARAWRHAGRGAIQPGAREDRAARPAGPGFGRADRLFRAEPNLRQDRLDRHVRACRDPQSIRLFQNDRPLAERRRASICTTRSRGLRRPATLRFAAGSRNIRR